MVIPLIIWDHYNTIGTKVYTDPLTNIIYGGGGRQAPPNLVTISLTLGIVPGQS